VRNIIFDRFRPLPKIIKIGRVWNESVPIQLTQCRFLGLSISSAKILIYFFKYNIRKLFCQTAPGNCYGLKLPKNADCSLRKQIDCVVYYNFRHTFVPCHKVDAPSTMARVLVAFFSRLDARLSRLALLTACLAVGPSIGLTGSCELSPVDDASPPQMDVDRRWTVRAPGRRAGAARLGGGGGGGAGRGGSPAPGVDGERSAASLMAPRSVEERRMSSASELDDGDVCDDTTICAFPL